MSAYSKLGLVAQGIPPAIVPGETAPNLVVITAKGTMCLYVVNGQELWITTGVSAEDIYLCGQAFTLDEEDEIVWEFDRQTLLGAIKGLYDAYFLEIYTTQPEVTGSFHFGTIKAQTKEQAEEAVNVLRRALGRRFGLQPREKSFGEQIADEFWEEYEKEVGEVGDLSIWEDALGEDDDEHGL